MARLALLAIAAALAACGGSGADERAQAAADRIRGMLSEREARALTQHAAPDDVRTVQEALSCIHEYQGERSGVLDAVTVNAIAAFQRSVGLEDDGVLTADTVRRLETACALADQPAVHHEAPP